MPALAGILPVSRFGSILDFPLISSKIHYDLVDVQSLATLVLTYASNTSVAMEVKYVCPLPSDTSVCSFKAVIDGKRTVKGVVKDKIKAKADYDAALAGGKTAALLEQNNVEIFQVSLGNIHYKQVIDIHISLASLVTGNGELDSLRLVFPSVIARRYGTPPNELLHWLSRPIKSALDFSVSIQMTSHIKSITSPSHPISLVLGSPEPDSTTDFDPFKAHVSLTSQDHLDKDIVVVVTCQGIDRPRCTVESYSPEEGGQEFTDAYSLTLVPRFELPPLPKQEYIFLVDRSGSMQFKMNAVRGALQIMLRSLPCNNTTFNIFSFGWNCDSLWPSSVAYDSESLKSAATYVDGMEADYGGTEIQNALHAVLQAHAGTTKAQDVPLTVFILTDGEAYDLSGVQSTIASHIQPYVNQENFLRIFCMGIGATVSKAMCDLIARAGQGAVVYVGDEKPDRKLMTLLRAARGPIITNISIDWGTMGETGSNNDNLEFVPSDPKTEVTAISLSDEKTIHKDDGVILGPLTDIKLPLSPKVQQAPTSSSFPSLYPGFRTSIFAIIRRDIGKNPALPNVVHIKGIARNHAVQLDVPVTPISLEGSSDHGKIKYLHVLAARALVQRFEDEKKKTDFMSDILRAEVLRIALRYGIATSETSFIAVDNESVPIAVPAPAKPESDYGIALHCCEDEIVRDVCEDAVIVQVHSRRSSGVSRQHSSYEPLDYVVSPCVSVSRTCSPSPYYPSPRIPIPRSPIPPRIPTSRSPSPCCIIPRSLSPRSMISHPPNHCRIASCSPSVSSLSLDRISRPPSRSSFRFQSVSQKTPKSEENIHYDLPISVDSVARYQTFEGSFDGSIELHRLFTEKDTLPTLPDALQRLNIAGVDVFWCSVLCIAFLQIKFPDDEDVWGVMVEKAEAWITENLTGIAGVGNVSTLVNTLKEEAKTYIV